jgi:hypothetical protein
VGTPIVHAAIVLFSSRLHVFTNRKETKPEPLHARVHDVCPVVGGHVDNTRARWKKSKSEAGCRTRKETETTLTTGRERHGLPPVFVFLSIPLVHRRVSPDINTPQSSS